MSGFLDFVIAALIAAVVLGGLLTAGALYIWVERRMLGFWQDRLGPNRVGPFGILQVVADTIKLVAKQDYTPPFADRPVFVLAPVIAVAAMLAAFAVIPLSAGFAIVESNIALLFFLAMSSLAVYSVVLAGWSSNSKYALLGGMRAAAQLLSYEVFMGLSMMGTVVLAQSFDLRTIVAAQAGLWFIVPQFLGFVVFLVAGIAETHRLPFDLPEGENELGAGYHTEYSAMKFGLFFLGEYVGMIVISAMVVTLFLGGWRGPLLPPFIWFLIKTAVIALFFILLRAALPRPRYDQLMDFGWKVMLPVALLNLAITGGYVLALGGPG
jgi:NADH-quinone oxidoreductase subunit H